MEERKIVVNGINLRVLAVGQRPPVLLLHGFPDTSRLWRHVMPSLVAAGLNVIAYDQRGFGQSDAPKAVADYQIDKIVSDAIGVLKELGLTEKVRLVEHDWGAFIGWCLRLTHPELVDRYVTISVRHPLAYRNAGLEQSLKGWYIVAFQIPGLTERFFSSNNYQRLKEISKDPKDAEKRVTDLSRTGKLTAAINWYKANFWKILAFQFARSCVPTMGVYSTGDAALTEKQVLDSQLYMNADWRYVNIQNSTHWIPLDQPQRLSESIIEWFQV